MVFIKIMKSHIMKSHSLYIQGNISILFMVYIGRWEVLVSTGIPYLGILTVNCNRYLHCCDVLMWQGNLTGKRDPI